MNIAYDLTSIVAHPGALSFIAGYLLIGNWLKWTILIIVYPVCIWMLDATTTNPSIIPVAANRLAMLLACGYAIMALLTLLKNRKKIVVNGSQLQIADQGFYAFVDTEPKKKVDKIGRFLSDEKLTHFNSVINQFLIAKKPFLQQKYSLRDLASDVDIPVNYLSAFINRFHKMNYSDFINSYRVSQARESILNGEWKHKTLEAIASEAGFNNRNTFTAAFRKETGQSPSEFLREIKKDHRENRSSPDKSKKILA